MKNYKKIYKRLIKEIKEMREGEINYKSTETIEILKFLDNSENKYGITILDSILEMNDEIEGKKCNMVIMNEKDFEQWQNQIKK